MGRIRTAIRAYAVEGHSPVAAVKRLDPAEADDDVAVPAIRLDPPPPHSLRP